MSFLEIERCWESSSERTMQAMMDLYCNLPELKKKVAKVLSGHLLQEDIQGKKILLKPNWVRHETKPEEIWCLRTHDNLLLAVLEEILQRHPEEIMIGDAPIQGCDWNAMCRNIMPGITALSDKYHIPVKVRDFRRVVFDPRTNKFVDRGASMPSGVFFDLGKASMLEPLCNDKRKPFRILQYPSAFLAMNHYSGVHRYCITPEFFQFDTVITLPKIKTHEKVGLTNALKILVGINGDKNYLPHHRIGGTAQGGDCYAGKNILRRFAECIFDIANTHIGHFEYRPLYILGRIIWKLSRPKAEHPFSAGWFGNDTTWRMVMDLNLIAKHGKSDGTIDPLFTRRILSLSDGIIAGQGNGPLRPAPLPLGILMFTDDSGLSDMAAASLMGISADCIPLLHHISLTEEERNSIFFQGEKIHLEDLSCWSLPANMPSGWIHYKNNGKTMEISI